MGLVLALLLAAIYLGTPVLFYKGWKRWVKRSEPFSILATFSLIGFGLSSVSALIALGTVAYALLAGGFSRNATVLMPIFAWGLGLSTLGVVFSLVGFWKQATLRYFALLGSAGTLLFWMLNIMFGHD